MGIIKFIDRHLNTLFFIFALFVISSVLFIIPAYDSSSTNLVVDNDNSFNYSTDDVDFSVGGYYLPQKDEIVILKNSTIVLRHELCHRQQNYNKKLDGGFMNELECYIGQYFFWKKVNLTTLDWENEGDRNSGEKP